MKTKFLFGLALLALVGCTADVEVVVPSPTPDAMFSINLSGDISQEYLTRVDDGGFCDGDQIGLYGVNYTNDNSTQGSLLDEGNQVDNAKYTYDQANNVWNSAGSVYYKDAETNIDLFGYYPYAHPASTSAYEFEVKQDQANNGGYAASDFLWGKVENVAPSENRVRMTFYHRMASVSLVLKEGTGFAEGEFGVVSKSANVSNTTRRATINLATGDVTAVGEAQAEGTLMMNGSDGAMRAIVVPQSVAANNALLAITVDGYTYRFKKSEAFTYEAGKQHTFTIKVNRKSHTGEYEFELINTEITNWIADVDTHGGEARQYYVVHLDEAGTLEAKINADGKNPAKIKNLKVSGKICATDFTFMRDKMDILQAVNLKESTIVGSWYYYINVGDERGWFNEYFEGDMPESEEECRQMVRERYPNNQNWSSRGVFGYSNAIPYNAFSGKASLVYFVFPEVVTKIGSSAFNGTLLSGALIIPNDVVEIDGSAFAGTNITSLQLPHNIKVLGGSAFSECTSLSGTLSLPESLEIIGSMCFYGCSMLSGNLVLPTKLTMISSNCFRGCGFSGDLIIPEGVEIIENCAFDICKSFNGRLVLPHTLKEIGGQAFSGCNFQGELVIPKYVQVIPDSCFANCDFSSIVFEEGSELLEIEIGAFAGNNRLCEPIIFPDNLLTLSTGWNYQSGSFDGCSLLPEIVLPAKLTVIGGKAFKDCYGLSKITCEATTPPVVGSGAFNGVAKDNFTLEVPENAVAKYQSAAGWSDFRRIAAHYDFSISRSEMRVLNAEHSATYLLRTPNGTSQWSVESCPEWVTVTPSSGVGKTEVVVTVNAMDAAEVGQFEVPYQSGSSVQYTKHAGRAGEIVFLLEGKDYRSKMSVQQYDAEVADGDVIVNQTATVGDGVNIVFMGDCFDAKDIAEGKYLDGINKAIAYYFAVDPYTTYRDYFNVYTVVGMSPDTGMGTVNTIKDAKFGSQYSLDGITPDTQVTYEYAMKCPTVNEANLSQTLVVMVENTSDYGGICYMWGDGSAIAICPMSADAYPFDFRGIVQHEAGGHGFGKLGDEYIYHNAFIQSCDCTCCSHLQEFNAAKARGWYRNMSTDADMNTVEWSHLIFHPTYSARVDMYEGGYFHTRGVYRSESASCMNNNIPYFSAISRQEIVERIMRYAGLEFSIDDFYANDNLNAGPVAPQVSSLAAEVPAMSAASASKQMHPKFMGEKPELK
ncbi:MAG: leucine-rich repeat protein [Alistipes sp.]|nr:leucine-rich repeat protein [Alistipes sp.]